MGIISIAFIECTLDNNWSTLFGYPSQKNRQTWSQHKSLSDEAEVRLVDIKNDRRYFAFKIVSIIEKVNNVISFMEHECEELAIDESKKFPKNKAIND